MSDELLHYGIIGQKWGVRRYQYSDGSLTSAGKKRYAKGTSSSKKTSSKKEEPKKQEPKKTEYTKDELMKLRSASEVYKHREEYTDSELRAVMGRIQSETQLKDMMSRENAKSVSKGKALIKEVVAASGKEVLKTAVTGAMKYSARKALVAMGNEDLAKAMFGGETKKREDK